jgi:hypothetical protein
LTPRINIIRILLLNIWRCPVRISRLAGKVLLILALVTLALSSSICAWGQASPSPAAASTGPKLQAELLKTIDASHARVGDEVIARTITPIEFNRSKFPAGAVVKGHVAEAAPDRLLLVFDSIMTKKNAPVALGLSLRAAMMPKSAAQSSQISPRAEAGGVSGGVDQALQNPGGRGDMLRSPSAAAEDSTNTVFQGPKQAEPVMVVNGGVMGLPGVDLKVSPDPKAGAAFAVAKNNKLQLEKGLQLMFVVSTLP